jgi:hypothetical protein
MKTEDYDRLALARQIRAAGRPVYIAEDDDNEVRSIPTDGIIVRQGGGVTESRAVDYSAGTAFIVNLIITNRLPRFAISDFGLELPWNQESFWLPDPSSLDGSSKLYHYSGDELPEFKRREVINHWADSTRIISRGQPVKGFLLGWRHDRIPKHYRDGMMIPATLIIYDQWGRRHRSTVEMQVQRRSQKRESANPLAARQSGFIRRGAYLRTLK